MITEISLIGLGIGLTAVVVYPTIKIGLDLAPFLYTNTRLSSRTGLLLSKKQIEDLINSVGYKEALALLDNSYYSFIVEHSKSFNFLSEQLYKDLFNTYNWLQEIVPSSLKNLLIAVNKRFEIQSIKNIYNILISNLSEKEKQELIQKESKNLNIYLRIKMENVKDLSSLALALEDEYDEVLPFINNVQKFNTLLDRFYLSNILSVLFFYEGGNAKKVKAFREYFSTIIDLFNLRLFLSKQDSVFEDILYLDGGKISLNDLNKLNDYSLKSLSSLIEKSPYSNYIKELNFQSLEKGFYLYLKELAEQLYINYNLQTGALVHYIILKEIEIKNLNMLMKFKSENFDENKIREYLIL